MLLELKLIPVQFLFQVTMAMLTLGSKSLAAADDHALLFNALTDLPSSIADVDLLMKIRSGLLEAF
jgi:hypothetical protein